MIRHTVLGGKPDSPDTPKVTLVRAHDETIISLRSGGKLRGGGES
jgi:hypothetical protein